MEKTKEFLAKYWYFIAITILTVLLFRQCNATATQKRAIDSINGFVDDSTSYYKNRIGQEVAEKKALRGQRETLEFLLSKQVDSTGQLKNLVSKFKRISSAGNIAQEVKIDTVFIPYETEVETVFNKPWAVRSKHYNVWGYSSNKGVGIDNITMFNNLSFAIGDRKIGFLKDEYRIEAVNSNPNIRTVGLDAYTLDVPVKRFGLSLYAGYGLSDNFQFSPSIGLAFTYTLIRF